jgi:hypothetical protein
VENQDHLSEKQHFGRHHKKMLFEAGVEILSFFFTNFSAEIYKLRRIKTPKNITNCQNGGRG